MPRTDEYILYGVTNKLLKNWNASTLIGCARAKGKVNDCVMIPELADAKTNFVRKHFSEIQGN